MELFCLKDNIIVSACLLGEKCRYDGEGKLCRDLDRLRNKYNFIAVCPEILGGLKTPRSPSEICGGRVVDKDGKDNTEAYLKGAKKALEAAERHKCTFAVLKSKSPSCGKGKVYDGSFSGRLVKGNGITAELFKKNGIRVLTEEEI